MSKDLLKGTLKTIVLKLLLEKRKMYGYEITQSVKKISDGKLKLTYGALYPTLHKLEADGYLKTETKEVDNRLRKYYLLTTAGTAEAKKRVSEYADFAKSMEAIILSKI